MTTHKAASFINAGGEHIESYQLLNELNNNKACAVLDLRNGKVERFDATPKHLARAKEWLGEILNRK